MKSSLPIGKAVAIISIVTAAAVSRADPVHAGACADFAAPVWSYTPPRDTELVFNGTTDPDGNLYWVEYQPALGSRQLVSATRDGSIRYSTDFEGASDLSLLFGRAAWADGFALVASRDNHVWAFDAKTGDLVWDTVVSPGPGNGELTDTGTQVIAATYGREVTGIDLASGEKLWTHPGETCVSTVGGDIFLKERDANVQTFLTRIDSSGRDIWSEPAAGFLVGVLSGETPLLAGDYATRGSSIVVRERWWELPYVNSGVVAGNDFGFLDTQSFYGEGLLDSFSAVDGSIIGEQKLSRRAPYGWGAGRSLLTREHLLLLWQETGPCPCLCHPVRFLRAKVSAWTKTAEQLFSCDLPDVGEAGLTGVALHSGRLVIGRFLYLDTSCTHMGHGHLIEAYDVPGEELAEQGWVVDAGNPAQTHRPLR